MRPLRLFWLLPLLALLVSCGPRITVPELLPPEAARLEAAASFPDGLYRLQPGDVVQIRYTFHPEMDQREVVRPDGKIRAAEVGEILVAGFSTTELERQLVQLTSTTLRDPEVVVNVAELAPRSIYVAGEVGRPGPIPYRRGLTPLQAIVQAGGLRETALTDSVVLVRASGPDGETVSRKLDLQRVLSEGSEELLSLAPHDVVFVPRTGIAEANIWVDQHFTQLFPFFRGAGGSVRLGGQ